MAEVVKTGPARRRAALGAAGRRARPALRRVQGRASACATRTTRGARHVLNLGHTFAHALEAAAGYDARRTASAVALGLLAALRLSGRDTTPVEEVLAPEAGARRPRCAPGRRSQRDKKAGDGCRDSSCSSDDGPADGRRAARADGARARSTR